MSFVTVYEDNPAGRLHTLLMAFKQNVSQHKIGVTWAATLGMPQESPDFLVRLALVYGLPAEIAQEMAKLDNGAQYDGDMALRWLEPVQAAFGISLFSDQKSLDLRNHLSERTVNSLENCSFVLHQYRRQPAITDSDVERIRECIYDLEDEINSGDDVDPELRTVLLYHSRLMRRALDDLGIVGNAQVEEALDQALGVTIRRGNLFPGSGTIPRRRSSGRNGVLFWPPSVYRSRSAPCRSSCWGNILSRLSHHQASR